MRMRALIAVASAASLATGLLFLGQPASAASLSPKGDGITPKSIATDILEDGLAGLLEAGAFSFYNWVSGASACTVEKSIETGCVVPDDAKLDLVLAKLDAIAATIQADHASTTARIDASMQADLKAQMQSRESQLAPLYEHGPAALQTLSDYQDCVARKAKGETTCDGQPIDTRVRTLADALIVAADKLPDDIAVTASIFTGVAGNADNSLVSYAWRWALGEQNTTIGGVPSGFVGQNSVPFVTPWLATWMNGYLKQQAQIMRIYGVVKPIADGLEVAMNKADGSPCTDMKCTRTQAYLDDEQKVVRNRIANESTARDSVMGVVNEYQLPKLVDSQLLVATPDGSSALLYGDAATMDGTAVNQFDIEELSVMVNAYANYSNFAEAFPSAFPAQRRPHETFSVLAAPSQHWYTAMVTTTQTTIAPVSWSDAATVRNVAVLGTEGAGYVLPDTSESSIHFNFHLNAQSRVRMSLVKDKVVWSELEHWYADPGTTLLTYCNKVWCGQNRQSGRWGSGTSFEYWLRRNTGVDNRPTVLVTPGATVNYDWLTAKSSNGYIFGPGAYVNTTVEEPSELSWLVRPAHVGWPAKTAPDCPQCNSREVRTS